MHQTMLQQSLQSPRPLPPPLSPPPLPPLLSPSHTIIRSVSSVWWFISPILTASSTTKFCKRWPQRTSKHWGSERIALAQQQEGMRTRMERTNRLLDGAALERNQLCLALPPPQARALLLLLVLASPRPRLWSQTPPCLSSPSPLYVSLPPKRATSPLSISSPLCNSFQTPRDSSF